MTLVVVWVEASSFRGLGNGFTVYGLRFRILGYGTALAD